MKTVCRNCHDVDDKYVFIIVIYIVARIIIIIIIIITFIINITIKLIK
jgi:hypothetical protein